MYRNTTFLLFNWVLCLFNLQLDKKFISAAFPVHAACLDFIGPSPFHPPASSGSRVLFSVINMSKSDVEMEDMVKCSHIKRENGGEDMNTCSNDDKGDAEVKHELIFIGDQQEPATPTSIARDSSSKVGVYTGETTKSVFSMATLFSKLKRIAVGENDDGTPEEQATFMKEIESLYRSRAMDFKPPKSYGQPLNCLKLWRALIRLRGYDRVCFLLNLIT